MLRRSEFIIVNDRATVRCRKGGRSECAHDRQYQTCWPFAPKPLHEVIFPNCKNSRGPREELKGSSSCRWPRDGGDGKALQFHRLPPNPTMSVISAPRSLTLLLATLIHVVPDEAISVPARMLDLGVHLLGRSLL